MLLSILFAIVLTSCLALTARKHKKSGLLPLCAASVVYLLFAVIAKLAFEGFAPAGGTVAEAGGIAVLGVGAVVVFLIAARWIRKTAGPGGEMPKANPTS